MVITVTLPDELAKRVQARGLDLDDYVAELVKQSLPSEPPPQEEHRKAVEAMMHFAEKHGFKTGGQDIKGMLHEGHKY